MLLLFAVVEIVEQIVDARCGRVIVVHVTTTSVYTTGTSAAVGGAASAGDAVGRLAAGQSLPQTLAALSQ